MPADSLAPPRPELLALLDAVKDHPDDDTPRLVLADWLDDQDNPLDAERAKFIREDITAHSGLPKAIPTAAERDAERDRRIFPSSPEYEAFRTERQSTGERLERWLGRLGRTVYDGKFHRGLPVLLAPPNWYLRPEITPLLASEAFAFVQLMRVAQAESAALEEMVAVPEFRYVPGMSYSAIVPLGTQRAERIFASPNLVGLRQIDFYRAELGIAGTSSLAGNPALSRLRKLLLIRNKLVDGAVKALTTGVHLLKLEVLNLSNNLIGDKGAEALAGSNMLASLRELDMRDNPRLKEKGKQLLRDKFGDRVKLN